MEIKQGMGSNNKKSHLTIIFYFKGVFSERKWAYHIGGGNSKSAFGTGRYCPFYKWGENVPGEF